MLSLSMLATWKAALNWFFKEAGKHAADTVGTTCRAAHARPSNVMTDVPSLGAADLGRTPWERRLIEVLRSRHYRWRTELAYRHWACRFAQWLEGRAPARPRAVGAAGAAPSKIESATAADVRDFLTDLAVAGKVAASTQNQALSALLFLYDAVLHTPLGWVKNVERAKRPIRLPVVLTREEVQAVLAQLTGTYRLMANLLYGAGLRLMDCVRLRVPQLSP
jgi:site-specific recombinase XerD